MTLTEAPEPVPADDLDQAHEASRRRAIFGLVGGFLLVLVIIVTVQWITDSGDSAEGDPLPELTLTTLDGEPFLLASLLGQPTVINFFASWCAPCLAEMPDFEQAHQANLGDVRFLGVNTRETDPDSARRVVGDTGVTYTILMGDDGGPGSLYQAVSRVGVMPTTAFVDASGNVVAVHEGILTAEALQDRIEEFFG